MSRLSTFLSYLILCWLISLHLVNAFDKACHILAGRMAGGSSSFKTIGQLADRLMVVTKDDIVYNLPATTLKESHLTIDDNQISLETVQLKAETAVSLQFNESSGILRLGILQRLPTQRDPRVKAFVSILCDIGSSACSNNITEFELPSGFKLDQNLAFINSPVDMTFNILDAFGGRITRYCIEGIQIVQCAPTRYLCRLANITEQLEISTQACSKSDLQNFKFSPSAKGFSGFISQDNLYLFEQKVVKVIKWPAKIDNAERVDLTSIEYKNWVICEAESAFYFILFCILGLTSLGINLLLLFVVLKQCGVFARK